MRRISSQTPGSLPKSVPVTTSEIAASFARCMMRKRQLTRQTSTIYTEIISCALANWDKLAPYYDADLSYASAEGFQLEDFWRQKTLQQYHKLPRNKPSTP